MTTSQNPVRMNHFRSKITSPVKALSAAYLYIGIVCYIFSCMGLYDESTFFEWGPPIQFLGSAIDDDSTYYFLLCMVFVHQLLNNCVNEVTYPWIINCVQDSKSKDIVYGEKASLVLINMFTVYSELDVIIIIAGVTSQISFFCVIIIANILSVSIINWQYIIAKRDVLPNNDQFKSSSPDLEKGEPNKKKLIQPSYQSIISN